MEIVPIHNEMLKKIEIMKFSGKWTVTEWTVLSGAIQMQKDKYHVFSLMYGS